MRFERPDSLRALLLRRLWLPLLLVMALGAVGSFALARHYAEEVHDRWLWDSAMSLQQALPADGPAAGWTPAPALLRMLEWDSVDRIYIDVRDGAGARVFGTAALPAPAAGGHLERRYYDAVVDGRSVRVVQVQLEAGGPSIRVAETRQKRQRLERKLLLSSIPLQAALFLLAGLLVRFGIGAAVRAANQAAHRLSEQGPTGLRGRLDPRDTPRELLPAVDAFNALIDHLAQAQQAQQRFVANAAHQLRTPLAALQVQLESALREAEGPARQDALQRVGQGLARLGHVTHQILMLNRSESSPDDALPMARLDLAALCRQALERHADDAIARGVDLGYDGPDAGVWVDGDPQLLRELVANLVDNALRYGRPAGVVTLSLATAPVVLCVDDDGPGIPEDERPRVVERFYRRAHDGAGCGLGLPIVREIAARHGAGFVLAASPSGGVRALVRFLPAGDAPAPG